MELIKWLKYKHEYATLPFNKRQRLWIPGKSYETSISSCNKHVDLLLSKPA